MVGRVTGGIQGRRLLFIWAIMELNLVGFVLFCFRARRPRRYLFKYFIVQGVGSSGLLTRIFLSNLGLGLPIMILITALLILKVGAAPFHFWFVSLIEGRTWSTLLALSFPQKFLPIIALGGLRPAPRVWVIFALVASAAGRLRSLTLKTLLGYSSVFRIGWVIAIMASEGLWPRFLRVYTLGVIAFISPLKGTAGESFLSRGAVEQRGVLGAVGLIGGLRMAGFPPTPGFLIKLQATLHIVYCGARLLVASGLVAMSIFFLNLYLGVLTRRIFRGLSGSLADVRGRGPLWGLLVLIIGGMLCLIY